MPDSNPPPPSGAITASTLVVAFILMYAVKATGTLRVTKAGELEGLDIHEHGMTAYPEYVIHGYDPTPHHIQQAATASMPAVMPSTSSVRSV